MKPRYFGGVTTSMIAAALAVGVGGMAFMLGSVLLRRARELAVANPVTAGVEGQVDLEDAADS